MTQYWTRRRKWSLAIHVAFVLVPFTLSTVSALLFWAAMFGGNWYLAVPMVAVIEVLSLVGLVLFLTKIESPFVYLRHLLPFISIVPLGRELYLLLAHNTPLVAWSLTVIATLVLVVIAWQCFRTIERLFIDPVVAARERAHEQAEDMARTLAQAEETISILHSFAARHLDTRKEGLVVTPAAPQPTAMQSATYPALSVRSRVEGHVYILRSEHGPCKIGCSKNYENRVRDIASVLPFGVQVVHAIKTTDIERLESGLHAVYSKAQRRINNEWFHLSDDDLSFLAGLGTEIDETAIDAAVDGAAVVIATSTLPTDLAATLETKKRIAAQMRQDRKSWREIADAVGRSPSTVREWLAVPASEDGTITLDTIEVEGE